MVALYGGGRESYQRIGVICDFVIVDGAFVDSKFLHQREKISEVFSVKC
jgi:hypothetical protein